MTPETIIDVFGRGVAIMIIMISVISLPGLIVGLVIAVFQAATQINEMSLNFIPKLIITFVAMMLTAPWLLNLLVNYTQQLIRDIPFTIG